MEQNESRYGKYLPIGTVGIQGEAGDDFHIDRAAFYVKGVGLVANIDETGADIEEYRAKFAEEYGVDLNDVEMSFNVGKGDGLATGWIIEGNQMSYDEINAADKARREEQIKTIKETESFDEKMKEIDNKYTNMSTDVVENKVAQVNIINHSGKVEEVTNLGAI